MYLAASESVDRGHDQSRRLGRDISFEALLVRFGRIGLTFHGHRCSVELAHSSLGKQP